MPCYDDGRALLYVGHVLDVLAGLEAGSIQTCVTSPPYWGLRAYGTDPQVWGGEPDCAHDWIDGWKPGITGGTNNAYADKLKIKGVDNYKLVLGTDHATCLRCGAWRGELGIELNPEYARLIEQRLAQGVLL